MTSFTPMTDLSKQFVSMNLYCNNCKEDIQDSKIRLINHGGKRSMKIPFQRGIPICTYFYEIIIAQKNPSTIYEFEQPLASKPYKTNSKCKKALTQKLQFLQSYNLEAIPPPRIIRKIAEEVDSYTKLRASGLNNIRSSFIYEKEGSTRIAIASKFINSRPLKTTISTKNYFPPEFDFIDQMHLIASIILSLHDQGKIHGDLSLSNAFYKKSQSGMVLGRPRLQQIDKWLNLQPYRDHSISTAPEIDLGFTARAASDVWQLGALFLQLALRQDLEEKSSNRHEEIVKQIGRVKNEHLQDFLKRMLVQNPGKRATSSQVLSLLQKLKANSYVCGNTVNYKSSLYRRLQVEVFLQRSIAFPTTKFITEEYLQNYCASFNSTINIINNTNTVIITATPTKGKQFSLFFQLPSQFKVLWLKINNSYEYKMHNIIWTSNGLLTIHLPVDPVNPERPLKLESNQPLLPHQQKRIIHNNYFLSKSMGSIKAGTSFTCGLLLSESLVLSVGSKLHDKSTGNQVLSLTFINSHFRQFLKKSLHFPDGYLKDRTNLHNSYCLMQLTNLDQNSCFFFKRLIKNYSQDLIDRLAADNNVHYNYQIGECFFRKGELQFDKSNHLFKAQHKGKMIPGEPLTVNFSNNNYAVVGVHIEEGRGITFDNQFSDRVFQWAASCEVLNLSANADFSFTIIDCAKFTLEKSEIICIGKLTRQYQIRTDNQLQRNVEKRIKELSTINPLCSYEEIQLGRLLLEARIGYLEADKPTAARESCQRAEEILERHYRLPVCTVVINFNLAIDLLFHDRSSTGIVSREQRDESFQMLYKCIQILERLELNPLLLAHCYGRAAIFLNDRLSSVDLHMQAIHICQRLRHRHLLENNLNQMINDYSLPANKVEELYLKYKDILYDPLKGDSPEVKMEQLKRKIGFLRRAKKFKMANSYIRQLMEFLQAHFLDDEDKENEANGILKSYIIEIMVADISEDVLHDFEKIMKIHAEDTYIHFKDSFRKKEALIKGKQRDSLFNLFGLLGGDENND